MITPSMINNLLWIQMRPVYYRGDRTVTKTGSTAALIRLLSTHQRIVS